MRMLLLSLIASMCRPEINQWGRRNFQLDIKTSLHTIWLTFRAVAMSSATSPAHIHRYAHPSYGHVGWFGNPVYQSSVPAGNIPAQMRPTKCPCAHYKREHKITYAALIAAAIVSSPEKELRMEQIYDFIQRHHLLLDLQDHLNWKVGIDIWLMCYHS